MHDVDKMAKKHQLFILNHMLAAPQETHQLKHLRQAWIRKHGKKKAHVIKKAATRLHKTGLIARPRGVQAHGQYTIPTHRKNGYPKHQTLEYYKKLEKHFGKQILNEKYPNIFHHHKKPQEKRYLAIKTHVNHLIEQTSEKRNRSRSRRKQVTEFKTMCFDSLREAGAASVDGEFSRKLGFFLPAVHCLLRLNDLLDRKTELTKSYVKEIESLATGFKQAFNIAAQETFTKNEIGELNNYIQGLSQLNFTKEANNRYLSKLFK